MTLETTSVPEDRAQRVKGALEGTLDALKLARREASGAASDPARLKWVAFALVTALQGSLVAALSGYDTAARDAVLDPGQPDRIAPVTVLLRRASSAEHLNPPERADLPARSERALARVLAVRNAAVHALGAQAPAPSGADLREVLQLIGHFLVTAPAFDTAANHLIHTLIRDELSTLRKALPGASPD